jgi:hypothetical protein
MTGKTLPDRSRCLSWREISQSDETFLWEAEYGFTIEDVWERAIGELDMTKNSGRHVGRASLMAGYASRQMNDIAASKADNTALKRAEKRLESKTRWRLI